MKRARSSSIQQPVTQYPRPTAPGGTPEKTISPSPAAEGTGLLFTNAASPQGRRTLRFTLNGTASSSRIGTAYQERVDALPHPLATVSVSVDPLPRYVSPAAALPKAPPIPAQIAKRPASGVVMSENAFARWRRIGPTHVNAATVDFAEAAARTVRVGMDAWLEARLKLQGEQRIRFLMESLPHVIEAKWSVAVALIFREAPLERLQRMVWPGGCRLAHLVLRFGDRECMRTVLGQNAARDALTALDRHGMTPLHLAVAADDAEATGKILDCQDLADALLMTPNREGWSPIHLAARAGAERAGRNLLLRQQLRQRRIAVDGGQRAIHIAAIHAHARFVKLLLKEHAPEQLCAADASGRNALMHAVRWGASAVVKELLAVGSALHAQLLQRDAEGMNALQHAQAGGNREVLGLIEAAMRKAFPESDQAPLRFGDTRDLAPQDGEDGVNRTKQQE